VHIVYSIKNISSTLLGLGIFFSAFYALAHRPMVYNPNQSLTTLPQADKKNPQSLEGCGKQIH
jgi:hypothetical protein